MTIFTPPPVPPPAATAMRDDLAIHAHHLSYYGGHFGVTKTAARLACRYWWPRLRHDVCAYVRTCTFCPAHADSPEKWRWLILPIRTAFEPIAIDGIGALPLTQHQHNHILVIIDHHTRWVELVPLHNPTAAATARAILTHWISSWGVPGAQSTSALLKQLCATVDTSKIYAFQYSPRDNSIVESYIRPLGTTLKVCIDYFKRDGDKVLPAAALAYRSTRHSVTRFSPYFLVTGQEAVLPLSRECLKPKLHRTGAQWVHA
ncbi:hypothetical protein ACSSS7_007393 [Eimeria intestinalis]